MRFSCNRLLLTIKDSRNYDHERDQRIDEPMIVEIRDGFFIVEIKENDKLVYVSYNSNEIISWQANNIEE